MAGYSAGLLGAGVMGGPSGASFVKKHGGHVVSKYKPDEDVVSDESRAERDEDRAANEALAAKYREVMRTHSQLARALLEAPADGEEGVPEWMARRFQELGIRLPCITVAYTDLAIETDAAVGAAGIPTVASWLGIDALRACGRRLACKGSGPTTCRLPILRGVQGVLRPGRLTLLLGPPGAGKSVLLQTLSGQMLPSKRVRVSGGVRYNGVLPADFDLQRTAAYVDQYDIHLPLLTVRETLEFAHHALWASGAKQDDLIQGAFKAVLDAEASEIGGHLLPPELREQLAGMMISPELMVEFTLRLLGLEGCADTVVGDAMIRGISGGQKRRLTCGELLVGGRELLLLDEISTGLDSATTATVCSYLGKLCHVMQTTTVVSLLQPSGDVLALFDDIMLLADGRMLYHGPVDQIVPHFESLGFACPPRKEVPAFLQDLTSSRGQRELAGAALAQRRTSAGAGELLMPLEEMDTAFWGAAAGPGADVRAALEAALAPATYADVPKTLVFPEDVASWWSFFVLCSRRQFSLLARDTELLQGRVMQVLLAGFIVGTLFVQLSPDLDHGSQFLGVCFMSVGMLAFISLPLTGTVFTHKPTFLKQRSLRFFPPSAFGGALLLQEVPVIAICTVLFAVLVYFTAGFTYAAAPFFVYCLTLLAAGLVFGGLFIALAAVTPTLQITGGLAGVVLLMLLLMSGFCIIEPKIPGWWVWFYWANPMSWAYRSVSINEFSQPRWGDTGDVLLGEVGMPTDYVWVWKGIGFNFAVYALVWGVVCGAFWITPSPRKVATVGEEAAPAKGASKTIDAAEAGAAAPSAAKSPVAAAPPGAADDGEGLKEEAGAAGAGTATLDIPFSPITLVFDSISYYVNKPGWSKAPESKAHPGMIQLLHNVSGLVRPGQLACLMGASGAGKTTLLDVLAGRKTQGIIEGEIRLNGHPKEERVWRRVAAYVEQTDIHTETATVREALLFSARLRLPASVSDSEAADYADTVLDLVELTPQRNALVGVGAGGGADAGLSLEQRKRLSLSVELVANPAVIFMDEPTSGLDGHAAAVVMRVARAVANLQRTLVCTIHQPSAEIFYGFDVLVLLQTGGHMMYMGQLGHESADLIAYMSAAGVRPILPGENPANWMLDVAGGSAAGERKGPDFVELYKTSELLAVNAKAIAAASEPAGEPPSASGGTYAASLSVQLRELLSRQFTRLWRLPGYSALRLIVAVLFALVLGSLYWDKGQVQPGATSIDLMNSMSLIFMSLSNLGSINMQASLVVAAAERTVLYREQAAACYSPLMYVNAAALVELPWVALQVMLFLPIMYFMAGFNPNAGQFFYMALAYYLSMLIYTFFGQLCLHIMPNVMAAQGVSAVLAGVFDVFNGFFIAKNLMGWWWRWFWYINPAAWMAYATAANQMAGQDTPIVTPTGQVTTVGTYLEDTYGYHHSMAWPAMAILLGFLVVFRGISTWAVAKLNWSSR